MKKIKSDIQKNEFERFYLLCGEEDVLKRQYRDKLMKAMFPDGDEMNLNMFSDSGIDPLEVVSLAETLPFFAEYRLIVLNDSGWFKKAPEDFLKKADSFPESTRFVFVEKEVDKRNKLYSFVKSNGYIAELNTPTDGELIKIIASVLKNRNYVITVSVCEYFLEKVGNDMARIQTELDKLCAYCVGKTTINKEDIDEICTEIPEGKIFQMLDAIMYGDNNKALKLYADLIAAQEKPMVILYMLNRCFNQLYQIGAMTEEGESRSKIIASTGIRDFQYDKYVRALRKHTSEQILKKVKLGTSLEYKVKSGDLDEKIAVEIFVVKSEKM